MEERFTATEKFSGETGERCSFHFMSFSPDGRRVVTDSADHTATLWDPDTGRPALGPLRQASDVQGADFSVDGTRLLTVAADHTVRVWNATTGESIGAPVSYSGDPSGAKFSPNATLVLTSLPDGTVQLWDAATGAAAHGLPLNVGGPGMTLAVADFSPDGTQAAAGINDVKSANGIIRIWDASTGSPVGEPLRHKTAVSDWHFSPDGNRIATVSVAATSLTIQGEARIVRLWDAHTAAPLSDPVSYGGELIPPLQFSPNGKTMLIGTTDAHALVWSGVNGAPLKWTPVHQAGLTEVRVSPDGARIVSASLDQTARVWDAHTGTPLGAPLHHDGVVWSVRFSADGKRIATASGDKTAQVWDADTHLPVTGPLRHDWPVRFALFSPDARYVQTISVARDRRRLWPVLTATEDQAQRLADLAEAIGGSRIDDKGALVPLSDRVRALESLRQEFEMSRNTQSDLDRIFNDFVRE
jgi:WD40 repeat protein